MIVLAVLSYSMDYNEDVRWDFFLLKSIGKLWTILSCATSRKKIRLLITSQCIWIERNPTVHLHCFIHTVRTKRPDHSFSFPMWTFLSVFSNFWIWKTVNVSHMTSVNDFHKRSPRGKFWESFTSLHGAWRVRLATRRMNPTVYMR